MSRGTGAMIDPSASGRFTPHHPWDRNAFLAFVAMIWTGILMGFGGQIIHNVRIHAPPYPLIVHFHAVAFVSWLALLTSQVLLIRAHRPDIHRRLGVAGAGLAAVMLVLGPATALIVDHLQFGGPHSDPPFLIVQLTDMVAFAGLAGSAIALHGQASAHKRLILLSTLYISDAGFSRWLGDAVHHLMGEGSVSFFAQLYLANDVLILGLGAYDLISRRRLHPAYLAGLAWVTANQLTATALYTSPMWKHVALRLIGH
jgi:hypothetical protein